MGGWGVGGLGLGQFWNQREINHFRPEIQTEREQRLDLEQKHSQWKMTHTHNYTHIYRHTHNYTHTYRHTHNYTHMQVIQVYELHLHTKRDLFIHTVITHKCTDSHFNNS